MRAIEELSEAIGPLFDEFRLEIEIAKLVRREIAIPRLERMIADARRLHRKRSHLERRLTLEVAKELRAA